MSDKTPWTDGPWIASGAPHKTMVRAGCAKTGRRIANCHCQDSAATRQASQNTANAHLIASAPELAEALATLRNNVLGLGVFEAEIREAIGNTNWECLQHRVALAEAALAKARGEQS